MVPKLSFVVVFFFLLFYISLYTFRGWFTPTSILGCKLVVVSYVLVSMAHDTLQYPHHLFFFTLKQDNKRVALILRTLFLFPSFLPSLSIGIV
ncbi:hypothetical protein BO85DRAFT_255787 [Aspergillus piperis CBS 112811]|uniref:Uncharacterized protein n=1 Tax=Aspergillus piperis CBS 112811 TaxID=1448313 RepID=A0A8G1R7L9_9EURO|nr:hypothetical protein BO85DRAFT_255787 [Aspergillus piperis CBS 112811]RAH59982.1 hypothetical protein BO85DRAFT_255787 [Aspergillus piperis CBS 112811]